MAAGQKYPLVPGLNDESVDLSATSTTPDEEVKVSANDTTKGKLIDKVAAGAGIVINELNDGADEDLEISRSPPRAPPAGGPGSTRRSGPGVPGPCG